MKARFLLPLAALALMTICNCNRHQGYMVEKPLDCNVVSSEVFGGNYTAADLKFYRVVGRPDDEWKMVWDWVFTLPENFQPNGETFDFSTLIPVSDTAAIGEKAKTLCMQMSNDTNKFFYAWQRIKDITDDTIFELLAINCEPLPIGGDDVVEAHAVESAIYNGAVLNFAFNDKAAKTWAKITYENVGYRLAIAFAGKVLCAPRVNGEITGGRCTISGLSAEETCALAKVLNQ